MLATPLGVPRPGRSPTSAFVLFRVGHDLRRSSSLVMAPFGVFESLVGAGRWRWLVPAAGRAWRSRRLVYAFSAPRCKDESAFALIFRLGHDPAVPVLRRVLPDQQPRRRRLEWLARLTPLWHGVNLTRMLVLDTSTGRWPLVHVAYLVVLAAGRLVAGRSGGSTEAAGGLMAMLVDRGRPAARRRLAARGDRAADRPRNYLVYRAAGCSSSPASSSRCFYLFSIGIGVGQLVTGFEFNGQHDPLRRVRRARHARRLGDERRAARLDVQLLLQAEVRQALRPDAGHPADHDATSPAARSPGACCAAASTPRRSSW